MSEAEKDNDDWRVRAESAEAALQLFQAEANARLIRAELKVEAVKAGMIDLDGLKLIDAGEVRLREDGGVEDAGGVLSRLKRSKPWLFGGGASSSVAANPPRPEPARTRHANDLSHEEWLQARAVLLRRR